MNKILKLFSLIVLIVSFQSNSYSKENFFEEAIKLYEKEKYEDARFLFERNIVFNPKDANSYLYLAKIYNQEENQRGAHINVSGIALTKNSKNKENAVKLIKYLQSDEAQKTYVNNTYEYSVNPSIIPNDIVKEWGEFKMDDLDLNMLGSERDKAIRIFDKSGWK